MATVSFSLSVITLNLNGLNSPIKDIDQLNELKKDASTKDSTYI